MPLPAILLGAGKLLAGGVSKKALMGAVKSGAKNFAKDKAKDFLTGKGRKKKSNRKPGTKEVNAIVKTGGSSVVVRQSPSVAGGAIVPYSPQEDTKAKTSGSGTATYERIGKRLTNIVSLTETLNELTKKQYSNTKKSAQKKRVAADKAKDTEREGILEKGGKKFLGFAGNQVSKAAKGLNLGDALMNILLGGIGLAAIELIQKHGVGKGLSILTTNFKNILYGMRILKGALNSLGAIAWKTTKFAFRVVGDAIGAVGKGISKLTKIVVQGIGKVGRGVLRFVKGIVKGGLNWARNLMKGASNLLRGGKGASAAAKAKGAAKIPGAVKEMVKGIAGTARKGKGAAKGIKAANKIVPFARGAKKGKGLLPGAAPFVKRISKLKGMGGVPFVGPLLTFVASLLDPEVNLTRAVFRTFGTFIGEMVGNFVGGAIAAGTGGLGAIAVPILNVTGGLLGEYLGDVVYIAAMGGGMEAAQKKLGDDIRKKVEEAIDFGKFVGGGLSRFYEGMPKIKLPGYIVSAIDLLTPGFDAKQLNDMIPDIGWWLNPFTITEKVDLFKMSFFDQRTKNAKVTDSTHTWRTSLEEGGGRWVSPDPNAPTATGDGSAAQYVPETESMAEVGAQMQSGGGLSTGTDAASKFYNRLVKDGVSPAAAAGIVGNIEAESGFDPAAIEKGTGIGRGLIQWSYGRRDAFEAWAARNNLDPDSMEANYGYLLYEMKGNDGNQWMPRSDTPKELQVRSYQEYLEKAKDPETAAKLFMYNYERPAVATQHLDRRIDAAKAMASTATTPVQSTPDTQPQATTPIEPTETMVPGVKPSAEYDVIIPVDHVKPENIRNVPDTPGGNTFKNASATGAMGRERDAQDPAIQIIKKRLEQQGLRVKIYTPEDAGDYRTYDNYLKKQSNLGTRIVPIHFDAGIDPKTGKMVGTGFLTRTRKGDAADAAFAAPIQKVLEDFQRKNRNLGKISKDTAGNRTVNMGAASPTVLIELGVQQFWEEKYGKQFTQTPEFRKFAHDIADSIAKGAGTKVKRKPSGETARKSTVGNLNIAALDSFTRSLGGKPDVAPTTSKITGKAGQSTSSKPSDSNNPPTSGAYASGLKTGPSARIGGSTDYHIDTKFKADLSMDQKIAMMDQLSMGYAAQGRKIQLSNQGVAGRVYSHTMKKEDKIKLLNKAFAAHSLPRGRAIAHKGYHALDYFIPKISDPKGRWGATAEQAEILVPTIDGGKLEYHTGGGYGRFVHGVDKDGNVIFRTGHGDTKTSANRGVVDFGKQPRSSVPTLPDAPPEQPPTRRGDVRPSVPILPPPGGAQEAQEDLRGAPAAPVLPAPTGARLAPAKPQCDCSGVEKFADYEVGGAFGSVTIPVPVIYGSSGSGGGSSTPQLQNMGGGRTSDIADRVNSFWKKQLSSFLYKFG